tara:strand:- start:1055 stop:1696 length:642 start_codon:yes stop_codon:yes gene_type:complete
MKVKINKEGKTKTYKTINKWSDVTLEKWLKLVKYDSLSTSEETLNTISLLSDMPKKLIKSLSIKDIAVILNKLSEIQKEAKNNLKKVITIDNVEYGFHPDLDEITLGEYADIETIFKNGIEKSMPELMAILYRPITNKKDELYDIAAYDGNIRLRAEQMKKMSAEQVQSALVFFWSFVNELLVILPSCLTEQTKEILKVTPQKILQTSGGGSE